MPNTPADSRYLVRSVARAADVLEALSTVRPGGGLSATEVAQACGLSKSSAFATLYTLATAGLVADDGTGKNRRYRLGMALVRLGGQARAQISLCDVAHSSLTELTGRTGMTSRLAVPEAGQAVVVDQVSSENRVQNELRMGQRELPHCTGLGKAILASLPDPQVLAVLARVGMPARTERTVTDPDTLLTQLADIRRTGYAMDDEEDADGVFCIGSAVLDHEGRCAGAISITGLKLGQRPGRYAELGRAVHEAAAHISGRLGYTADA